MNANAPALAKAKRNKEASKNIGFQALTLNNILLVVRPQDWFLRILGTIHLPMLLALSLVGLWITKGRAQGLKDRLVVLYILFIVMCGMSILYAVNGYWAYKSTLDLVMWLFGGVLPMAVFVNTASELRKLISVWVIAHVVTAMYAEFMGNGTGPGGYLSDENDVAVALVMALPFAYLGRSILYSSKMGRVFGSICALLLAFGVVASQSRGGFVALLVTTLAIIWFSPNRIRNLVLVGVLGIVLYLGMSQAYLSDMATINNKQDSTRVARLYSWGRGWEMFLDNPVLGVGAGNYPWRVDEYQKKSKAENVLQRSLGGRVSHSLYFTLFPETGLLGSVLFFSMLFIGLSRLNRVVKRLAGRPEPDAILIRNMSMAAMASIFGLLSGGAFISVLYYPHFWYWLGMVVMLCKLADNLPAVAGATGPVNAGPLRGGGRAQYGRGKAPTRGRPGVRTPTG